ncbi:MAG: hypothetical protein ACK54C_02205 [Betaproteobacteria bacterium]
MTDAVAERPAIKLDDLIGRYVKLRDKKDALKKKFDEDAAALDAAMEKVENFLLNHFNMTGADSVKTPFGTAYKQRRTSATVADRDSFVNFCQTNSLMHLIDVRVGKKAVEEYRDEKNDLPPGINYSEFWVVNIRRS